jgi:hypothetical protein
MLKILEHQLVDETIEDGRTVIKTMGRCWKEIKLIRNSNIVNVSLQDYLGNPLSYEPVAIRITGESALGETLEPFEGECDDGTIELAGYVAGDKLTVQSLNENVENTSLEVVV